MGPKGRRNEASNSEIKKQVAEQDGTFFHMVILIQGMPPKKAKMLT